MVVVGGRRRLEEIKWAGREDVCDCRDQSVSNAESNPRKIPSVYVFSPFKEENCLESVRRPYSGIALLCGLQVSRT